MVAAMTGGALRCAPMAAATRDDARALLGAFLDGDEHYRASAAAYGDGGTAALDRALDLFLARPELGFVWLAHAFADDAVIAVGACVVCRAISTSRGTVVAKLDDVSVHPDWRGRGVGAGMLAALRGHLRTEGMSRIDCGCHRANEGAWRFYERLGFRPLDEERIALLL
jgi:ribosomal protein S18 acetylase RimI-like enzyme